MTALRVACATLLSAVCLAAPFLWILALAPLRIGVWGQTEGISLALHVIAAVCGLSLFILACIEDRRAISSLLHPIVLALLGIAAWSLAMSAFIHAPVMSLVGHPELGIGSLWHAEAALMMAAYLYIGHGPMRMAIAVSMLASAFMLAADNWLFYDYVRETGAYVPYDFLQYLGPVGVMAGAAAAGYSRSRWVRLAALLIMVVCVWLSFNKTVRIVLVTVAILAIPAARRRVMSLGGRRCGSVVLAAILLMGGGMWVAAGPLERLTAAVSMPLPEADDVQSASIVDHVDITRKPWGSAWLRSMMWRVSTHAIDARPGTLATGMGWGSFRDIVSTQGRLVPGRSQYDRWPGSGATFWDARTKSGLHSHNLFLEALLSAGIPASLLTIAVFVLVPVTAPPRRLPYAFGVALALSATASLWFLLNSMTPFFVAALAGTGSPFAGRYAGRRFGRAAELGGGVAALAFGCLSAAVAVASIGPLQAETLAADFGNGRIPVVPDQHCAPIRGMFTPTVPIAGKLYVMTAGYVAAAPDSDAAIRRVSPLLSDRLCALQRVTRDGHDAAVLEESLRGRIWISDFLADQASAELLEDQIGPALLVDLVKFRASAPLRTDMFATFSGWALRHGNPNLALGLAMKWTEMPEGDPVRDWLQGRIALSRGDTGGSELVRRALHGGIANWIQPGNLAKAEQASEPGTYRGGKP